MPVKPNTMVAMGTEPGVARNMPTNAHSNMSNTTLGLHISR